MSFNFPFPVGNTANAANYILSNADKKAKAFKLAQDITLATKEAKNILAAAKTYMGPNVKFKYNLPPHNWSLPVRPVSLDYDYLNKTNLNGSPVVSDPNVEGKNVVSGSSDDITNAKNHGFRRSRIYFHGQASYDVEQKFAETTAKNLIEQAKAGTFTVGTAGVGDRNYGFQFLWNPTDINVTINRNADILPSAADNLGQMTGNYQGQEQLNFSIIIDRTNDFACAKGLLSSKGADAFKDLTQYYSAFYPQESHEVNVEKKIKDLLTYGTMADLEYLFKTTNGNGTYTTDSTGTFNLVPHKNSLGKITADTGYLATSIIAIEFGPSPTENLSYTGWFESLSISHTKFTENMIPLTSVVNVSMTCFTTQAF
jgi:hypothetical protein